MTAEGEQHDPHLLPYLPHTSLALHTSPLPSPYIPTLTSHHIPLLTILYILLFLSPFPLSSLTSHFLPSHLSLLSSPYIPSLPLHCSPYHPIYSSLSSLYISLPIPTSHISPYHPIYPHFPPAASLPIPNVTYIYILTTLSTLLTSHFSPNTLTEGITFLKGPSK